MKSRVAWLFVWLAAFGVYAATAYRTINWWDASEYSLVAWSLGIAHPPGSLLLTLLGWLGLHVPLGISVARQLSLIACAVAASTVALTFVVARALLRSTQSPDAKESLNESVIALAAAAVASLGFAFAPTPWLYAVQFTPYVLTPLFTALLLLTLIGWWQHADDAQGWVWLLVLGLLFGLDYSVHRTNAVLFPGATVWVLIRKPSILRFGKAWTSSLGGLVAGLSLQLLLIPISRARPLFDFGRADTWSRFYDYESLKQMGGGFLVKFYPRNAPLWSVQTTDFARALGANFGWWGGPWRILGVVLGTFAVIGAVTLWRRDRRLALAFGSLLALQAAMTVAFFNIPANFFRTFERHYLPVFVTCAVLVVYGAATSTEWLWRIIVRRSPRLALIALILPVIPVVTQLVRNWRTSDGSHRTFARDFAVNMLVALPEHAILFTYGDNDTMPLWYEQAVEHVRPDVRVVNLPLLNTDWYIGEVMREDPQFPMPSGWTLPAMLSPWRDTTLSVSVGRDAMEREVPTPRHGLRSVPLHVAPSEDGRITRGDLLAAEIVQANAWRRPLALYEGDNPAAIPALASFARLEGLFWRFVPEVDPPLDREAVRTALLETAVYRGYSDPSIPLDAADVAIGSVYLDPLLVLLRADAAAGDFADCTRTRDLMLQRLPPARLGLDPAQTRALTGACDAAAGRSHAALPTPR